MEYRTAAGLSEKCYCVSDKDLTGGIVWFMGSFEYKFTLGMVRNKKIADRVSYDGYVIVFHSMIFMYFYPIVSEWKSGISIWNSLKVKWLFNRIKYARYLRKGLIWFLIEFKMNFFACHGSHIIYIQYSNFLKFQTRK